MATVGTNQNWSQKEQGNIQNRALHENWIHR